MADISSQQIDALIELMRKSASSLGSIAGDGGNSRRSSSSDSAKKTLERDLAKGARDIAKAGVEAIDSVRVHGNGVFESISRMASHGLRLAFVGEAVRRIGDLNKTYTSMAEVGQNFSGSMVKMSIAAGEAGLPLKEFADLITKNSAVAAELGANGFGQLAVGVRKIAEKNGMYGYSLDQLNSQTSEYLKTARLFGPLEKLTRGDAIKDFAGLAEETSALAGVTGKARSEITQLAQTAMRSSLVIGQMYRIEEGSRMKSMKTLAAATTFMASQQGEAGRMLSTLVAETFGAGSSIFTEGGKQFIEAGIGQMASATDDLNSKIVAKTASDEDYIKYQNNLIDTINNNIETLRIQAVAGNASASAMLTMRGEMVKMTMAQIRSKKAQMDNSATMTSFITSLESGFKRAVGGFESGFLKAMMPLMDKFTKWLGSTNFDAFVENMSVQGAKFGALVSGFFNDESVQDIMETGAKLWTGLKAVGRSFMSFVDIFIKLSPIFATVLSWMTWLADGLASMVASISQVTSKLTGSDTAGTVVGAGVGFAAYKLLKAAFSGFTAGTVIVKGGVINVLGAGGSLSSIAGEGLGAGIFGKLGKVAKFAANPKVLAAAALAAIVTYGVYKLFGSSPAEAKTGGSFATGGGLRVTDPNNISNPKTKARYQALMLEKQRLSKQDDSPQKAARLAAISAELSGIRNQYGSNVSMSQLNDSSFGPSSMVGGFGGGSTSVAGSSGGSSMAGLALAGGVVGVAGLSSSKMMGRSAALARQARVGGGAVAAGAEGAGASKGIWGLAKNFAGSTGGKLLGRLFSVYYLYSAYQRLQKGDNVGAAIDVAGAGVGLIPGFGGIAASLGVSAIQSYRDSNTTSDGGTDQGVPGDADTSLQQASAGGSNQMDQLIAQQSKTIDILASLMARNNALAEESNRLLSKINAREV